MRLVAERLTREAFAPFGHLLSGTDLPPRLVNEGRATRRDLASFRSSSGRTVLARYDVTGSTLPIRVMLLERHTESDQAFFALDGAAALVVVSGAAVDGTPDLPSARAFIARPQTPFLYSAGTWHAPLFALGDGGAFVMAMQETGTPADCETFELDAPLVVEGSWDAGIG
ncbi:ureidoglycolate lyase [Enterovirga sp. CN4-39]|uniref:ureidoglycolate lyase n=1 Tax=Enterovirga sp. CN4-39 TaxID=3400910 RepID=UPI003BFFA000